MSKLAVLASCLVFQIFITSSFAALLPGTLSWGKCPDTPAMSSFNTAQYAGKWYQIQNFPASFQNDLSCVTATYGYINDTSITVSNRGVNLKTNKESVTNGTARVPDLSKPNQIKVSFPMNFLGIGFTNVGDYNVWATDYTSYSLVYSCTNLWLGRLENAWILSRKKTLDSSTLTMLYKMLSDAKVDTKKFLIDPQSCNN